MALPQAEGIMVVDVPKRLLMLYGLAGFLLQCIPASTTAQPPVLQFEHLTTKDGLSDNHVWAIHQDRYGFMWFGTEGGLNRYDGHTIKAYGSNPDDSTSLDIQWVKDICEDGQGNLWVAAVGLHKYNREKDNFQRFSLRPRRVVIQCLLYDGNENVFWAGTPNGLYRFDLSTNKFEAIDLGTPSRDFQIRSIADDHAGNLVMATNAKYTLFIFNKKARTTERLLPRLATGLSTYVDNRGMIWIGTGDGLVQYDATRDALVSFKAERDKGLAGLPFAVQAIVQDSVGRFWIGTRGDGLNLFERESGRFAQIPFSPYGPLVNELSILSLYIDRSGNVWVGTNNGVGKLARWTKRFSHFVHSSLSTNSVAQGEVRCVIEDAAGNLWLVTQNGGVSRLDQTRRDFRDYTELFEREGRVRFVYQDRERTFWAGGMNGLMTWSPTARIIKRHTLGGSDERPTNNVLALQEDSNGALWVGTYGGVCRYDRTTGQQQWYEKGLRVWKIHEDRSGRLWVSGSDSSGYVFCEYDREHDRFVRRLQNVLPRIGRRVNSLHRDSMGRLWLGMGMGLMVYQPDRDSTKILLESGFLGGNIIFGILEDDNRNLWMSTRTGLVRLNHETEQLRSFQFPGLSADIPPSGYVKTKKGEFVFGLGEGFVMFYPDSIRDNPTIPTIVITDFTLFDEPVGFGEGSPLKKSMLTTDRIDLTYDQNTLTFEFAALDYTSPSDNQYAYRLEGFDNDWVQAGTRHRAHYTNVPPGEYVFRVKGSNNDGVWNQEGTSVAVIITPPWWKTTWAYLGYGLFILSGLYGIRRYEMNRLNLRNQLKLDEVRLKEREEADLMKSRFFANISHEFRTPLTLIKGPIEGMLADEREEKKLQQLGMMRRNAYRLLRLINQLLDLSKLEAGAMSIRASRGNIVSFVKGIASSFESSAGMRGIKVTTESDAEEIEAYFDRDKLEKILTNLLSNALKFTPDGGEVNVRVALTPHSPLPEGEGTGVRAEITIADTGIGIPADELTRVFDRFYQVDQSQTREYEGSGIGLALTKELVELHHGTISVRSEVGKGTEFTVTLPLGRGHLKDDEVVAAEEAETKETAPLYVEAIRESPSQEETEEVVADKSLPLVLIIEDNADVRAYMKEYLVKSYQVIEAHDGAEGIEKALETIPDLIISDVMMPRKDGFEVCKTLKLDEKTSHIPIILLTARAGTENKIEGLETGADDYLTKPFDAKELLARVKNLIEQRRKLRERFRGEVILKPKDIAITSADEKFLTKLMALLEAHIPESDFDTETLASELAMSRMQLHRKVKALTDNSPREFLRKMRVERATELLRKHAGNISEVAYEVGFANPAHFAQVFRTLKGVTPSEFLEKEKSSQEPMQ